MLCLCERGENNVSVIRFRTFKHQWNYIGIMGSCENVWFFFLLNSQIPSICQWNGNHQSTASSANTPAWRKKKTSASRLDSSSAENRGKIMVLHYDWSTCIIITENYHLSLPQPTPNLIHWARNDETFWKKCQTWYTLKSCSNRTAATPRERMYILKNSPHTTAHQANAARVVYLDLLSATPTPFCIYPLYTIQYTHSHSMKQQR